MKNFNMKTIYILLILFSFASCICKKDTTNSSESKDSIQTKTVYKPMNSACPENGKCTVEIFRNKSLDVKVDEFGSIYYNQIDNLETSIIVYSYNKNVPKNLQDANYREDIVFEIQNTDKKLFLQNQDLQKTKMLYGRFCFCRGQTGNYKIIDGSLNLTQNNNQVQFDLEFKNNKVPQLLSTISEIVKF